MIEVRREIRPPWPFRLPGGGMDGVLRRRGAVLERLLHVEGEPAVVRAAQPAAGRVVIGARAGGADVAEEAIARMRFALAVDDDLRDFHERFRDDPLIGVSVRRRPWLRIRRRPDPWEALAWAITEQLIETERAFAIQRRMVRALGRTAPGWDPGTVLRDVPTPQAVALRRAAREVASGRVDLRAPDPQPGWRRLLALPGIGRWTVDVLALHGQGRHEMLPAGDLGYLKLVGRLQASGDPRGFADEAEVRALFAPYGRWAGLAGAHFLAGAAHGAGAPPTAATPAYPRAA